MMGYHYPLLKVSEELHNQSKPLQNPSIRYGLLYMQDLLI